MSHVKEHCQKPKGKRRHQGRLWLCTCGDLWVCRAYCSGNDGIYYRYVRVEHINPNIEEK